MFKLTKLITLAQGADRSRLESALNAAAQAPGAIKSLLGPTLPDTWNGGDYIWHVQFADEPTYRSWLAEPAGGKAADALIADTAQVALAETVAYEAGRTGIRDRDFTGGIYRVMLATVYADADPARVKQFERELFGMGTHIHSVGTWQLSRAVETPGARRWTHVWEQDYRQIDDLLGPYMQHPYHWGLIDRWFDPQCPDLMFDGHICHTFCPSDLPMIAPLGA